MPKKGKRAMSTGGETGAKIGEHFGNMLEEEYNKYKHHVGLARGGYARGGYPAAGVGADVGNKIESWLTDWWNSLGFAQGGPIPAKMPPALKKKAKMLLQAHGVKPAAGVGADVGNKIEKWITDWWNSLARGGAVGHSVFR